MNPDSAHSERPFMPPQAHAGFGLLRWVVTLAALVVLVVGAYRAYLWLVGDVARRRAAVEQTAEPPPAGLAGAPVAVGTVQPLPLTPEQAGEPVAPAVVGGSLNRCLVGERLIYTNGSCPAGSRSMAPNADTGGAAGSTGVGAPPAMSDDADDTAGQQAATCNFLSAELARLDYEFHQPLPPPVLDDISSSLARLRTQAEAAGCVPPAKPAAAPARRASRPR